MPERADILISVHGRFADEIIAGSKRVELRRRAPKVSPFTRVWIYDKAPTASVRALAVLTSIETLPPDQLWDRHSCGLGLSREEYGNYVEGSAKASALILGHVHELRRPVELNTLRAISERFHPPQFYLKLGRSSAIAQRLAQEIPCFCMGCDPSVAGDGEINGVVTSKLAECLFSTGLRAVRLAATDD